MTKENETESQMTGSLSNESVGPRSYWYGNGKYQEDYNRLAEFIPKSGSPETLAGEIMRAIEQVNNNFYINGELKDSTSAIAFLATMGNCKDVHVLPLLKICHSYLQGKIINDCILEEDCIQVALECMTDRAIEFMLSYPDVEYYTENILSHYSIVKKVQLEILERSLATASSNASGVKNEDTPTKQLPLQEISTPKMTNTALPDDALKVYL